MNRFILIIYYNIPMSSILITKKIPIKIISIIFIGIFIGTLFWLLFINKIENSTELSPSEIKSTQNIKINLDSYVKFLRNIKFANQEKLIEPRDTINYSLSSEKEKVLFLDLKKFYQTNKYNQDKIWQMIEYLKNVYIIKSVKKNITLTSALESHMKLHTYQGMTTNIPQIAKDLETKHADKIITKEEMTELAYLYDLQGEYQAAKEIRHKQCEKFTETCTTKTIMKIYGIAKDHTGNLLRGVQIKIANFPELSTVTTDQDGKYKMVIFSAFPQKIRLKAWKSGYFNGIQQFYVLGGGEGQIERNFYLEKAQKRVILQKKSKPNLSSSLFTKYLTANTITNDPAITTGELENRELHGENYNYYTYKPDNLDVQVEYFFPDNNKFYDANGTELLNVDWTTVELKIRYNTATDEDRMLIPGGPLNYDFMLTNGAVYPSPRYQLRIAGMPYLEFETQTHEPLYLDKSTPIYIRFELSEWNKLLTSGLNGLTNKLTPSHIRVLSSAQDLGNANDNPYVFTYIKLKSLGLDFFPAYWILDHKKSVWTNKGFSLVNVNDLLDINGNIKSNLSGIFEAPFYSY